jgi:hypothetical protein
MSGWFRTLFLFSSFGPLYAVLAVCLHVQKHHFAAQLTWIVAAASLLVFLKLKSDFKQKSVFYNQVAPIGSLDENILSYMIAYLPPLLVDDFSRAEKVVPVAAFYAVVGVLMMLVDTLYLNPFFLMFGLRIYRVQLESGRTVVLVTRLREIAANQRLSLYEIQESRFYYAELPKRTI